MRGSPIRGTRRVPKQASQRESALSLPSSAPGAAGAPAAAIAPEQRALEHELAVLFVQALNLEVKPDDIDPEAPLFGDGLGLDSIDVLEVALEVSQRYGFQLRSDDENNQQIFRNLRSLALHVAQHRKH
ncbi:MAG: acyl carrier protein [Burkholderiales bacterium]|nr:acyl carrier protein [Burkholderiales bacterium]MDE2503832.1 acyl carrier protein [Burkholderiales bacterium]